jgi:hypothetical protein
VDPLLADAWADGVVVVHRGAIVSERYANLMAPETLHLSQSVGKSVLGLIVGVLGAPRPATRRRAPARRATPTSGGASTAGRRPAYPRPAG